MALTSRRSGTTSGEWFDSWVRRHEVSANQVAVGPESMHWALLSVTLAVRTLRDHERHRMR
jgi:hypothetical protein